MIRLKRLNNKGLTAVEILVCFVLMVILTVSMYGTVISYKNKQNIESDRDKIVAYKNLLTKEIQDDLIKKGLIDAKLAEEISSDGNNTDKYYKVEFTFRDGTKKTLEITAQYAKDFEKCSGTLTAEEEAACKYDKDDVLKVSYGSAPDADDYTSYVLPDLGYGYNGNVYASEYGAQCSGNYDEHGVELDDADKQGCKVYDFRISNVIVETEDIFNFYVGFYHPDFETRYGIDIVYPITLSVEQSAIDLGPICGSQTPERVDWENTGELTVTVECVAREGGMPCAQPSFSETFTGDAKTNYITIVTTDGNETKCPVITNIDNTKPNKPTIVATEGFVEGTWKNTDFTLMVTSSDRHSGIAYYQYCYPGADNNCGHGEWTTYENSIRAEVTAGEFAYETLAFSTERSEDVWIRAVDRASNASDPAKFRINLDKTGPSAVTTNFDVSTKTLTATLKDNYSQVAGYALTTTPTAPASYIDVSNVGSYNLSYTLTEHFEGTYYIWIKDSLGNVASSSVFVDTLPTVVLPVTYAASAQTVEIPYTGTYKLEVWGAQGGQACHHGTCNSTYAGGAGGYAYGEVKLTEGTILYVVTGGKGKDATNTSCTGGTGGYNGGGNAGNDHNCDKPEIEPGGGGGGATHIATASGLLKDLASNQSAVLIVAGGGGGGTFNGVGAAGGGLTGSVIGSCGTGGGQSSGNAFGFGGIGVNATSGGGGGGGGWYGGKPSSTDGCQGPGGSSYIGSLLNADTIAGQNTGNGKAQITLVD